MKGKYKDSKAIIKVLQWLGIMAGLTLIAIIAYIPFAQPQSTTSLKWLQLLQTVCIFLLPPFIVAWLWSDKPLTWLHIDKGCSWKDGVLAIGVMLVALPGINLLSYWNQEMVLPAFLAPLETIMKQMEEQAAALIEQFMKVDSTWGLMANLGLMAFLPAFAEELSFRGVMQGLLVQDEPQNQRRQHTAIWVTAILFSAIHLQFYGFFPRMLLGAMFGYVLCWSGSIWLPIIMHCTNNAAATIGYYMVYQHEWNQEMLENFGTKETLWAGLLSLVAAIGILLWWKREKNKESQI